ncbi:MAG: hypothetical protein HOZ81_50365 [Streptomyces sp.]|nr:hypothetical protein [Streptomyces sp.]NUS24379.1 hypothetical protein [Streptomyces sp.]
MGRPAPASLRACLRAAQHPATAIPCGHCGANSRLPCRLRSTGRPLTAPHDTRTRDWDTVTTTVCPEPTCQVAPGTPCRTTYGGHYPGVHAERRQA